MQLTGGAAPTEQRFPKNLGSINRHLLYLNLGSINRHLLTSESRRARLTPQWFIEYVPV
jgi:hypothetical protein